MKFDAALICPLADAADRAQAIEAAGFDGLFTFEGNSDIFFPLVPAAQHTQLDLATNVAIGFPRSPMHLAYQAWDLHKLSGGRFSLGLGTQIKTHIERRYSAVWGKPVQHMRELVEATKAIFHSWQTGDRLEVAGDYYTMNYMPPIFVPEALPSGPPPIWLGALGPKMTTMAAEVADGLWIHPFNTRHFLEQNTLPCVAQGRANIDQPADTFAIGIDAMVGVWRTEEEREVALNGCRFNLAFYGSTPAYRVTLDAHGWGDLQPRLRDLTKSNQWDQIGSLITDEVLDTIAVTGTPTEVAQKLHDRYGDIASRVGFSLPYGCPDDLLAETLAACRTLMP